MHETDAQDTTGRSGYRLAAATPAWWAPAVAGHVGELLVEQAHLEKKAAAAATRFLFQLPQRGRLLRPLSALAREELLHFERTLALLQRRGLEFGPQRPAAYMEAHKAAIARTMPQRLVDELLVAALIEERSCERMQRLAEVLAEPAADVAAFYRELCAAEARHRGVYVEIAEAVAGDAHAVGDRYDELAAREAAVLASLPFAPHLHGGLARDGTVG